MTLGIRINSIAEIIKQPGFRVNRGPYGNALSGYLKWVKNPNPEVVQLLLRKGIRYELLSKDDRARIRKIFLTEMKDEKPLDVKKVEQFEEFK